MKRHPWETRLAFWLRYVRTLNPSSPVTDTQLWEYGKGVLNKP